ncbi:xanthine dehydrogenase, molybdenum binding subunit apoprotein [Desulforamulus reducens MI-1]|uniref:Xanthine dehydrogenase, molybdenum binding subunit apoprotein n=1 Tax=Desulforamulus reducens (strain ATCC BAA-1160 / DSM 100696 / MI-1) TaxID=349161 RepID=A4J4N1_DESRM|nr:molybdopterin cofactor-binding domain-containing protein [Desulforamulus reducens]ABO50034.1 xanthine dehydrogenase, molybdenum binding subunit apoprotein [Desulforamulus reducens MI-1]
MKKDYAVVGKSVRRLDAMEKAMGKATFTTDIKLPGMLYGKVLRSPHPHARIVKIDTSKAEALPGVKAVATYLNTPRVKFNTSATSTFTIPPLQPVEDQYIFDSVVRYVGDEVAAVAAVSKSIAQEALGLIEVEYELLPTVFDPLEAMKDDAPVIHESEAGKNIPGEKIHIEMGDVEKGFNEADYVFEHTFKLPVQKQAQMETQAAVAQVAVDGKVTVWSTTQTPHPSRRILATIFGIPYSKVRVLNPPYIGGGFGVRIGLSAKAEPIALALAMLAKQPVKVVYDRKEDFIASDTRHAGYVTVKTGVNKDGTFNARKITAILNSGAYCSWSAEAPGVLGAMGLSIYYCPNQLYDGHSVYTNTTPAGAMRGFGNPQAMFAVDSQVDIIAESLSMDPLELRRKNMMRTGQPWVLPYPCLSSGLEECMDRGAKEIGWERRTKLSKDGTKRRGMGMAIGTHVSNAWPFCGDYSNAYVTVQQDGSVHVASGVPDMGTGTMTTLSQMAAEILGVTIDQVGITIADTESTPFEIGSHASRTCYASGTAVVAAAQDARKQVVEYAGKMLNVNPDELDIEEGIIYSTLNEEIRVPLGTVAIEAHLHGLQFIGVGKIIPQNAPPYLAHFAEVEVDTETGKVSIIKLVAAHDVGKAIHPIIVEGQLEGGLAMGVGYALSEEIKYDSKGKQLNDGFHKYMLPTAMDIPEMKAIIVEAEDPTGPFGAKGVGETGLVATAAAIANAVYEAIGIRFFEIPLTEERVYKALKERK